LHTDSRYQIKKQKKGGRNFFHETTNLSFVW
jgi:hypothetical protein